MTTLLLFARYFATMEHVRLRGHTHGGLPYTHHLAAVEGVLRRFGVSEDSEAGLDLLAAAWLHDIVEDSEGEVKTKHIIELFGPRIAALVQAVTKEPGTRKQSWPLTAEKIRGTEDAVLLKLADRIANVEAGGHLVQMYRKEHPDFVRNLRDAYVSPAAEWMVQAAWDHLDNLLGQ